MVDCMLKGDLEQARCRHHRLSALFKNCFVESNPIPVKAAMAGMGLISDELRLPLVQATESTKKLMAKTLEDLWK